MAKAVADVNNPDEKQGGFASDNSDITGFSHMHDSGTGGVRNCSSSKTLAYDSHRHPRWATSQYFHKPDALEISSTTASSPRPTEHLGESMALSKLILDTLPLA
jgi:putative alpha-1,2-mannosidase